MRNLPAEYWEGIDARFDGKHLIDDNPYDEIVQYRKWLWWRRGFLGA